MLLVISLSTIYLTFNKIEENPVNQKPAPNKFKQIAYINGVNSYWGTDILDAFGLNSECYNIFILTFWTPGWVTDALGLWQNIHTYLGTDEYGKSNSEI